LKIIFIFIVGAKGLLIVIKNRQRNLVTKEQVKELLRKEELSTHESKLLAGWMLSEGFAEQLSSYIEEDLNDGFSSTKPHKAGSFEEILDRLMQKPRREKAARKLPEMDPPQTAQRVLPRSRLLVAASILLALASTAVLTLLIFAPAQEGIVLQSTLKENPRGIKSSIFLRDGSRIVLNAESRVEYPQQFSDSVREVYLEGEAFFEVSKDVDRPFVVYSNDVGVKVLGTSFNINAYEQSGFIKVSLMTGRVQIEQTISDVSKATSPVVLESEESIRYSTIEKEFGEVEMVDPDLDFSWKDGTLVFKEASLPNIIARLERWYNVKFVLINDPQFDWSYTGRFHKQSLQDVLEAIGFSQRFNFEFKDDNVEITFKSI
jgi:transmembrane sensor